MKPYSEIEKMLSGNDSLYCILAIKYCVINAITDDKIISIIKKLKKSDMIEWNSAKVSDSAIAALHLLDIEKYTGNRPQILDLINTIFYTM